MPTTLGHWEQLADPMPKIGRVVCDGGIARVNPSPDGGMWAFRARGVCGTLVAEAVGVVLPSEIGMTTVSNNLTEALAVLIALEWLPAGWSGEVRTDSLNAIRVFRDDPEREWLPRDIVERAGEALDRVGRITWTLVKGHPLKKHIVRSHAGETVLSAKGYPYCLDNHWADEACTQAWKTYKESK